MDSTDSGSHRASRRTGESVDAGKAGHDTVAFIFYLLAVGFVCSLGLFLVACGRSESPDQPSKSESSRDKSDQKTKDQEQNGEKTRMVAKGKKLYNRHCASCHGEDGKGNGRAAEYLYPRPRDFTDGQFKYTSTAAGKLPTDQDLHETIANGLQGSGMPAFRTVLGDDEIKSVVEYVKTFSPRFEKQSVPDPISVPEPPEKTEKLVQRGQELYNQNACWTCHGRDGKGEGPSAGSLKGPEGNPVQPRDLTTGVNRAGGSPKELYKTIMTGITGTGMPGYASALSKEKDRWAMVYYVRSLSDGNANEGPQMPVPVDGQITAVRRDTLPEDPGDEAWNDLSGTRMVLFPLWSRPVPPPTLTVKAAHAGDEIALLLSWTDSTRNISDLQHNAYPDAVAVQYPVLDGPLPFIGMGSSDEKGLVRIWHWKSVRQVGKERGRPFDLEDVFPRMFVDRYFGQENRDYGAFLDFEEGKDNIANQKKSFQSAVDVENPLAKSSLTKRSVLEYLVRGFGSLTSLPEDRMSVEADGAWENGQWTVQFRRPLTAPDESNRNFEPGSSIWVGFAAFDGTYEERNGKKSISNWIQLKLQEK